MNRRYGFLFLTLAAALSFLAIRTSGLTLLALWPALGFVIMSAGYQRLGAAVFGKRADGSMPVWAHILHGPFMLYSHVVLALLCQTRARRAFDAFDETLLLGRRPRTRELPAGIRNIVDLTAEIRDQAGVRGHAGYVCFPILDGGIPNAAELRRAVRRLRPGSTLIHCALGHGRTGMFALALLAERGRIRSLEEGLRLLQLARPGIGLNSSQARFMEAYLADSGEHDQSREA